MKKFNVSAIVFLFLVVCMVPIGTNADYMNPLIVYNANDGVDPTLLSGTIDISVATANSFFVTLTNTSTSPTGDLPADVILTGWGFELPENVVVAGGGYYSYTAISDPFTAHIGNTYFTDPEVVINNTWGYDNTTPFNTPLSLVDPEDRVNVGISTLRANVDETFAGGALNAVDGPPHGIVPSAYVSEEWSPFIYTSATFEIIVSGFTGEIGDLVAGIQAGNNLLAFGSPTAPVPEPATLLLLGTGLVGLAGASRKKLFKRS